MTCAVEAGDGAGAGDVVENAVAADAFVEHAEVRCCLVRLQARCQQIRPAKVSVLRAPGAVGDAVAKGDDGGAVGGDFDVDTLEEGPAVDLFGGLEGFGCDDVAFDGVAGWSAKPCWEIWWIG